jgi:hypothetical protein
VGEHAEMSHDLALPLVVHKPHPTGLTDDEAR